MVWEDFDYCCIVCGLPTRSSSASEVLEDRQKYDNRPCPSREQLDKLLTNIVWLDDVGLLCDPEDEVGRLVPTMAYENLGRSWITGSKQPPSIKQQSSPLAADILNFHSRHEGGPSFYMLAPDPAEPELEVNVNNSESSTFDSRAYVSVHQVCLNIAARVMATSSCKILAGMRGFWTAIRWRHGIASHSSGYGQQANYDLFLRYWYLPSWDFLAWGQCDEDEVSWSGPSRSPLFNLCHVSPASHGLSATHSYAK